jgi:hypothetical protein
LKVKIGRSEKNVQAGGCRGLQSLNCGVNIVLFGSSEGRNRNVADFASNGLHGFQIAPGGDGKSGFNDVYTQLGKLARHADLLVGVHGEAGRLFAVA